MLVLIWYACSPLAGLVLAHFSRKTGTMSTETKSPVLHPPVWASLQVLFCAWQQHRAVTTVGLVLEGQCLWKRQQWAHSPFFRVAKDSKGSGKLTRNHHGSPHPQSSLLFSVSTLKSLRGLQVVPADDFGVCLFAAPVACFSVLGSCTSYTIKVDLAGERIATQMWHPEPALDKRLLLSP